MTQPAASARPWHGALRTAMVGWLWLAGLWAASSQLTVLPPWAWLLVVVMLLALPAWGMWLALMLGKRLRRLQFAPQGHLVRWLAGGWWPACKALVGSLLLCTVTLWQAWFLSVWEWGLLALAPALYAALGVWLQGRLAPEFASPGWTWAWSQRGARWLLVLLLGGIWLYGMARSSDWGRALAPGMDPAALDAALAQIQAAPSGLVRWGLDSLLTLQVAGGVMADLPQGPALRLGLMTLCGPVGVLLCLGQVLQGAAGNREVLGHAWPMARTGKQSAVAAWWLGLVGVLLAGVLVQTTAQVDALLRGHTNPLALQRMPECERIGQQLYRLGTVEATRQIAMQALGLMQAQPALCTGLHNVQQEMDGAVERYLDWYFSLGAEWGRILRLLTGNVEGFLQDQLAATLSTTPGLENWLATAGQQLAADSATLQTAQQRMAQTLERHHLALDASQCLLRAEVGDVSELPAVQLLGQARQRVTASAVVGTGAGAFAAMVAGKAMAKTSMKAASKVLAKAAAKQGLGKAGAAVAGAALGSVVPGVGTAVGAIAGVVAGAVVGVGLDWAALYAEEQLTRDAMRDDLRAALGEQMQALGAAWNCDIGAKAQP